VAGAGQPDNAFGRPIVALIGVRSRNPVEWFKA
jgi:hypothetical protein